MSAATPQAIPTIENVLIHLWEHAAPTLTPEELKWFGQSTEEAENAARALAHVVEGIGCLVSSDTEAGNFTTRHEVPGLLFGIAHQLRTIQGLIHVGDGAASRLLNPEAYRNRGR